MHRLGLGLGNHLMGLGQFLPVVDAVQQWIIVALGGADAQHVKYNLGVFGVILVPAVMQGLAGPGQGDGGNESQVKAGVQ